MAWKINYSAQALKALKKMDKQRAQRITHFMDKRIALMDNPKQSGKLLKGKLGDYWRFRVGDYRVLCEIQDTELVILAVLIGHRREVYQ